MSGNYLSAHQSRTVDPSPYEMKLAGAIEEIFAAGTHDLPGLLRGLEAAGLTAPDGQPWTEASFTTEIERLGA
ncbi:recombinase-like helix-turn-helix domain-containing protein [Streptomyces umbrinus]|uniref:recombinase-like helix-turn-helix domain-containing protein n=1 Tax=Streptomyces umbrinus TaxID=67370 RepID=UPI0033EF2F1B